VGGSEAYGIAMEELAAVTPSTAVDLRSALSRLRRNGTTGGVLVMVTGIPDDPVLGMYRILGNDFYRTIVMSSGPGSDDTLVQFARAGATTILSHASERWAGAWKQGMERSWSTATAG
jgi:hypothetical protein